MINDKPKYTVETAVWRKIIHAENTNRDYYTVGRVIDKENTLGVTAVDGNGGGEFFCVIHNFVYKITDECPACINAVPQVANEASVTSCDTS